MRFFVMNESDFWRYEIGRARVTPSRLVILSFAISLLMFAAFVLLDWLMQNVSLREAWQKTAPIALVPAAIFFAAMVGGVLFQEWIYRRTKALPASVRGFGIETRPTDLGNIETVRGRAAFAFDGPQRRDWERTRSSGMAAFVVRWFVIILAIDIGLFLLLSLLPGGARLSSDYEWGELAWMLGLFPLMGIVLGFGLWYLSEWSYRSGKARMSG